MSKNAERFFGESGGLGGWITADFSLNVKCEGGKCVHPGGYKKTSYFQYTVHQGWKQWLLIKNELQYSLLKF